jgi:predicted alpha/beta-hydrolase family hydrolase
MRYAAAVAPDAEYFEDLSPDQPPVRGSLHRTSSNDVLVLTHSAGGNSNAPLLVAVAAEFSQRHLNVLRCDLPFRQRRPHGPPMRTAAEDQAGLRRAAELMRARFSGRVFMGGHSYGGRMASMLLAADPAAAEALLLLSYPLHPPKKPEQMRTQHFPKLVTPTLFVQGTKDEFATTDEIETARKLMAGKNALLVIEGAGHSLGPRFAKRIVDAFAGFVR